MLVARRGNSLPPFYLDSTARSGAPGGTGPAWRADETFGIVAEAQYLTRHVIDEVPRASAGTATVLVTYEHGRPVPPLVQATLATRSMSDAAAAAGGWCWMYRRKE